jgi:hypothetical protein
VPKKAQFTRVEYNVFLFDEPLKDSKSLKTFKISLTFRFDNQKSKSKSVHIGENSQILTVSNKKQCFLRLIYHTKNTVTLFLHIKVWLVARVRYELLQMRMLSLMQLIDNDNQRIPHEISTNLKKWNTKFSETTRSSHASTKSYTVTLPEPSKFLHLDSARTNEYRIFVKVTIFF